MSLTNWTPYFESVQKKIPLHEERDFVSLTP